jgi:hypothetical protein
MPPERDGRKCRAFAGIVPDEQRLYPCAADPRFDVQRTMQENSATLLSRPRKVEVPMRRARRTILDQTGHEVMLGRAGRNVSQICHNEVKYSFSCRSTTDDGNCSLLWSWTFDGNATMSIVLEDKHLRLVKPRG